MIIGITSTSGSKVIPVQPQNPSPQITVAIAATGESAILPAVPAATVTVGDFGDLEALAEGCDLLVAHSHGRQAAERLGLPHLRVGFPIFDRLGAQHRFQQGQRPLFCLCA